ncbi:hypothetical protein RRG08_040985 [Elysia crispata]|uniref:Uncharacterized protein n=1 Tax=Elysia crispata TaxID=231223 RepID=A0AAE0ZIH9_9GAST|nr:hypothetical protein RRG08_040985 [Elysia crispata]
MSFRVLSRSGSSLLECVVESTKWETKEGLGGEDQVGDHRESWCSLESHFRLSQPLDGLGMSSKINILMKYEGLKT